MPKKKISVPRVRMPKKKEDKKGKGTKTPGPLNQLLSALLIFFLIISLYSFIAGGEDVEQVAISEVAEMVKEGEVEELIVRGEVVRAVVSGEEVVESRISPESSITEILSDYGVDLSSSSVSLEFENPRGFGFWLLQALPILLPIFFIILIFWYLSRQVKGAGMQAFNFGQSRARIVDPADSNKKVTFDDVAGVKEAKEELREIVDFLKNPKKYLAIGAEIPKGVLLMGAPGTGKTLLARAVAGEASVPFFSISGSEFVEMFVGVGASRVRDTFKLAKKMSPSIIFIDEIDAVGRTRGAGLGGGNDEREQTLNQILVEMDGFDPNEQVIVMAATNRPDVLDPALLRPGRFDRRVRIDLPDLDDRQEILSIHSKKKPLADSVNLRVIAERTPGFSGADLYSLVNEAAILAARENRTKVEQLDLISAIEKVMLGPERRSHLLSAREKKITAYHEAGHALVASILPDAHPVHKISIVSRGHAAGYTLHLPVEEKRLHSRKDLLADLAVSLGGYVTEEMVFGDITTGPSNDLQVVTARARDMVARYGMSEKVGPLALESDEGKVLYGSVAGGREYSEQVASLIDQEVSRLVREAKDKAHDIISNYRTVLDDIANELLKVETLERAEYEEILKRHNIQFEHSKSTDTSDALYSTPDSIGKEE